EPEQLAKAGEASVNIVASSSGLPLAKVLNKLYGTPYVVGLPIGKAAAKNLIQNAEKAIQTGENIIPVKAEKEKITSVKPVYIIGEPVFASELATCLTEDLKTENVRIISPFDNELNCGTYAESEDETFDLLKDAGTLIADPLYKRILSLNSDVKFIPFPHEAYSGRIYRSDIPMFIGEEIIPWLEKLL
ncbi:MAG: oxidoreductase, partial [Oscillospiraceae bacterium]